MSDKLYCKSLTHLIRLETQEVNIGGVPLGGINPIRVQTMTTTNTNDTELTIEQCIKAIKAGAEYIRITAQGVKEAKNIEFIKKGLVEKEYYTPVIVDIHFNPSAAIEAALHADKVRINPGNYADPRASFKSFEYTDDDYINELKKVEEKLLPLIETCKKRGVPLRIGVNHGSLSDRIMSRYGDTPEGMVQSALEFLRICKKNNFNEIVVSMKASNTRVMVYATRLMVSRMMDEGMIYPLHLGVTEAGDGEDGRIKSAVGIGTLLADGIGDTIRVSLTEDPEFEIPVAKKLVSYFTNRETKPQITEIKSLPYDPFSYSRRKSIGIGKIGNTNPPVVVADLSKKKIISNDDLEVWGWNYNNNSKKWETTSQSADFFIFGDSITTSNENNNEIPIIQLESISSFDPSKSSKNITYIKTNYQELNDNFLKKLDGTDNVILVLETDNSNGFAEQRAAFVKLIQNRINCPVIVSRRYSDSNVETFQLKSSSDLGGLLIDGLGEGIILTAPNIDDKAICSTSFSILQAARTRISKTEYISCPGCGRTLFSLQETVAKIKSRTAHLRNLKIGIMGCIVNGPGEMADADYGYVGAGFGKINLYKGKEVIKKNIPEESAVDELIHLIKENGDWNEPN